MMTLGSDILTEGKKHISKMSRDEHRTPPTRTVLPFYKSLKIVSSTKGNRYLITLFSSCTIFALLRKMATLTPTPDHSRGVIPTPVKNNKKKSHSTMSSDPSDIF